MTHQQQVEYLFNRVNELTDQVRSLNLAVITYKEALNERDAVVDKYKEALVEAFEQRDSIAKDRAMQVISHNREMRSIIDYARDLEDRLARFNRPLQEYDLNLPENIPPTNLNALIEGLKEDADTIDAEEVMKQEYFQCSRCGGGLYKSREDQIRDWPLHKLVCEERLDK